MTNFHPFHIVDPSPWPALSSFGVLALVGNGFFYLTLSNMWPFVLSFLALTFTSFLWWRDVVRESTFQGFHTAQVCSGLYIGVIFFLLSEVMFFFSFFFSFFFLALNPEVSVGAIWPPAGVEPISYVLAPFLNTIILLSSGVSVTWAHHAILASQKTTSLVGLLVTVGLGALFIMFQYGEYEEMSFTMADSVFGSLFYLITGFHGIHVIIGTIFILVALVRCSMDHLSSSHHLGFEASAWYWHFVDVVWLALFVSLYWWGS